MLMNKNTLFDECLVGTEIEDTFAHLCNCKIIRSPFKYKRGISDYELFSNCILDSIDAVITYDGADISEKDLSVIARNFYNSVKGYKLPGVVVLPRSNRKGEKPHSVALSTLFEKQDCIQKYINASPVDVLDLRRKRALALRVA